MFFHDINIVLKILCYIQIFKLEQIFYLPSLENTAGLVTNDPPPLHSTLMSGFIMLLL